MASNYYVTSTADPHGTSGPMPQVHTGWEVSSFNIHLTTRQRHKDIQFKEMKAVLHAIQIWKNRSWFNNVCSILFGICGFSMRRRIHLHRTRSAGSRFRRMVPHSSIGVRRTGRCLAESVHRRISSLSSGVICNCQKSSTESMLQKALSARAKANRYWVSSYSSLPC